MKFIRTIISNLKSNKSGTSDFRQDEAEAIILEFSPTGITKDQCKEIRILLHVMPRNGRNFVTECKPLINTEQETYLHSGYKLKVTLDPRYPHRILSPMFD
jgi:hypothetical protein